MNTTIVSQKWRDKKFLSNEILSFLVGVIFAFYIGVLNYWYQMKEGLFTDLLLHFLLMYIGVKYANQFSKKWNNKSDQRINVTTLVTFMIVGGFIITRQFM